jgi:hypothetical protein
MSINYYHLFFLVIASSIACLPIESNALSQNCNPIGSDLSQLSRAEMKREFTLKPGKMVEVPTVVQRGLLRSLVLSIEKFRDAPQPDKQVYQIKINHLEASPNCRQIDRQNVWISRFADYTLNPRSVVERFPRINKNSRRTYTQKIRTDGIITLELLDLTASGEAKIKLTREPLSSSTNTLDRSNVVKDRNSLIRLKGQKARLVGYYVSQTKKADPRTANTFGFTGEYRTSQIVLEDGTIVSVFPVGNKQFLRSAEEVVRYRGKIIEALGIVDFTAEPKENPAGYSSSFFINLEKLDSIGLLDKNDES